MKSIPIDDASAKQLADFAVKTYSLDVNYRNGFDAIRAKLADAGFTGDTITIADGETTAEPAEKPLKRVKIMIPAQDGPGGNEPVPLGINGHVILIQRDVEVVVTENYVQLLKDAIKLVPETDDQGRIVRMKRVPTHSFSMLGEVAA